MKIIMNFGLEATNFEIDYFTVITTTSFLFIVITIAIIFTFELKVIFINRWDFVMIITIINIHLIFIYLPHLALKVNSQIINL